MKYIALLIGIALMMLIPCQYSWALDTYDVGYQYLCKAILHSGKVYFTSSANQLVGEYDLTTHQVLRTWSTADYFPTQAYFHPDGNGLFVILNRYTGLDAEGAVAVIDQAAGNITIHAFDDYPMLNLSFDGTGAYIFAVSGYQMTETGKILKIDCFSWLPIYQADTGDYPLGISYMAADTIFTSCSDLIPTYYESDKGSYPGPPYSSKIKIYTDVPRLAFRYEIDVPEGLNFVKKMDNTRLLSFHLPPGQGTSICIIDATGATLDELEVPEIAGVLDAVYSPVTEKIYATVAVDAGNYDPETEVPELAYCGDLLVYDPTLCTYNLYEDYFDSQVSMINLYEGQLIVNSINSSKVYLETPF